MTLSSPELLTASILETSQQYLAGSEISPELEYKLGRACLAHCFGAASELLGSDTYSADELIAFVDTYGAGTKSPYYHDGVGWRTPLLADVARLNNFSVIVQDLKYDTGQTDMQLSTYQRRVTTDFEKSRLNVLSAYGGEDRYKWGEALEATTMSQGVAICSITIPLLSGDGYGGHAVLVTDVDVEKNEIRYFDPDFYNVARYGSKPVDIEHNDSRMLMYRRPLTDHLSLMSGSVSHVFNGQATK